MTTVAEVLTEATNERAPTKPPKLNSAAFKEVPQSRAVRDSIRAAIEKFCKTLDKSKPLTRESTREMAEGVLKTLGLGESCLGFTMVMLTNEFWREQVAAIPFHRRLMLLPHCLKNAEGCPAEYDELGLDCKKCGACEVGDFRTKAEELGYKVLVSEGTPIVLKIIVSGHVDAIVGVACLNVLEKAFDKVLLAGIPCIATPLLSSNCKNTSVDNDWVFESIALHTPAPDTKTKTYMHLMRAANAMFDEPELSRLVPRPRATAPETDPLRKHETIAYDFLARGGKRSRPFITLASYDALKGAPATLAESGWELPDSVKRAAIAIETFHKASLVHDDIEDDDAYRYGTETLHRTYGVGTAINVGDYLIGLGYRCVSRDRKQLGAEIAADILDKLADAHIKLSEGQGAELLWREAKDQSLTTLDALKIYALKTSPAFEAALYTGVRLAGDATHHEKMIADFSRNVGVAFQILNDIKDWTGDEDNKLVSGQDVLAARPTLLLALALEGSTPAQREELLHLIASAKTVGADSEEIVARVRHLYFAAKVFEKADKLVDKFRAKAESLADEVQPTEFRELLYYLVDSVLEKPELPRQGVVQFVELGK
ncbi:All-trans-nonaprenyl-diphosphate synthase (geranyl-diphosphate specific) [Gemmata sp. SH-PL17]|uniref:polyprenyl synthetase family protein n=1 Tax=Gemmata sp. SH-PL17 TaxID=1630693 RepID=UPI00078C96A2|nr:polyprenyl synthetase family protein [Gemmata sp. SH-PL17]AMV26751.1 All-trans-nonaprenyl-diphosphate synthase (geranyl-diphosphate specific) [Gemmata sp. SH-PL17]